MTSHSLQLLSLVMDTSSKTCTSPCHSHVRFQSALVSTSHLCQPCHRKNLLDQRFPRKPRLLHFLYRCIFSSLSDGRSGADLCPWAGGDVREAHSELNLNCGRVHVLESINYNDCVPFLPQCQFWFPRPGHFISCICRYSSASQLTCGSFFLSQCHLWHHFVVKCMLSPPFTFCWELVWPHT